MIRAALTERLAVLHDEQAITVRDHEGDEERYVTIGTDALGNVLVVVYTWRGANGRASDLLVKQRRKSASSTG